MARTGKRKGRRIASRQTGTIALLRSIKKSVRDATAGKRRSSNGLFSSKDMMREYFLISSIAVVIGILAGFGAILFRAMIFALQNVFFVGGSPLHNSLGWGIIIVPAIGGLIIGLIVKYSNTPEVKGHGVPEVMVAAARKSGKMKPRIVIVKAVASSVCIGSGGSVGREGPIVQIGSAMGSTIGQVVPFLRKHTRVLLACGGAGAIAATFNTPIAGVVFALEIILIEMKTKSFIPLVISSVFATMISRLFLGDRPAFEVPSYMLANNLELLAYLVLGLLSGLVAVVFILSLNKFETIFDEVKVPSVVKPAIGGLFVGIIALVFPHIMGIGYDTVNMVFAGGLAFGTLCALMVFKILGTSITIGSGGSGGVFAPSLFIGACLGGAVGIIMKDMMPFETGPVGAYALVGMAAVVAGTTRGTLMAIIMIFEMTRVYEIILPLMFACVISDAVANLALRQSIYTIKLAKKGVSMRADMRANILETNCIGDIMSTGKAVTIPAHGTVGTFVDLMTKTGHRGYPLLDDRERLLGIVNYNDVKVYIARDDLDRPLAPLIRRPLVVTYRNEYLDQALHKMFENQIDHLPVVDPKDERIILGIITKEDILRTIEHDQCEE